MLDYETYKEKMLTIANQYDKRARGGKYIRKWDYHWLEKKFFCPHRHNGTARRWLAHIAQCI